MNCYITNVFLKCIQEIQHFLAGTYLYVCLLDLKKRFPNITLIISFCWTSKRFLVWAFTYFWKYISVIFSLCYKIQKANSDFISVWKNGRFLHYRLTWKYGMNYLKAALTSSTRLICFCIIPCDTFKKSSLDNEPSQSHPASHTTRKKVQMDICSVSNYINTNMKIIQ